MKSHFEGAQQLRNLIENKDFSDDSFWDRNDRWNFSDVSPIIHLLRLLFNPILPQNF